MLIKESLKLSKYSSVAIIGGGIGGLSAARALIHRSNQGVNSNKHQLVDRVSIYEQADKFIPNAGAGFGFSPNGQICLSSIGIEKYRSVGAPFDAMKRISIDGNAVLKESNVFQKLRERHGFGFMGCLRSDIVDILVESLNEDETGDPILNYSHKLVDIRQKLDKVELEFENGHQDVVDLVVGADGIHSTVAKKLSIDDEIPPIYSGANIFYGKIPNPDNVEYLANHPIFQEGSVTNGPGSGEFIAFHVGAGEKKTFIWANTYPSIGPPLPKQKKQQQEWDQGNIDELGKVLSKFPDGHPIHTLADLTNERDLLHFGLYYRHHKNTWSQDRVVLLGDSCHATLPYVGQGANQAIEDAIYLAHCLDRHDNYKKAYEDYYEKRFPRTKRIVQMAGFMHKLYHSESWFMHKVLDFLIGSVINGGVILKQMEKEIIEECPVKDYKQYVSK